LLAGTALPRGGKPWIAAKYKDEAVNRIIVALRLLLLEKRANHWRVKG
jgi:hypothetical protein